MIWSLLGLAIGAAIIFSAISEFIARIAERIPIAQQGRAPIRPFVEPCADAEHSEDCACDECCGGPDCTQPIHQPWCREYREDEAAIPEEIIDDGELREFRNRKTDPAPMRAIEWEPPEGNDLAPKSGEFDTKPTDDNTSKKGSE